MYGKIKVQEKLIPTLEKEYGREKQHFIYNLLHWF